MPPWRCAWPWDLKTLGSWRCCAWAWPVARRLSGLGRDLSWQRKGLLDQKELSEEPPMALSVFRGLFWAAAALAMAGLLCGMCALKWQQTEPLQELEGPAADRPRPGAGLSRGALSPVLLPASGGGPWEKRTPWNPQSPLFCGFPPPCLCAANPATGWNVSSPSTPLTAPAGCTPPGIPGWRTGSRQGAICPSIPASRWRKTPPCPLGRCWPACGTKWAGSWTGFCPAGRQAFSGPWCWETAAASPRRT